MEWHVLVNANSTGNHSVNGYGYDKIRGIAEENWVWSPQGVVNMHEPDRWGILQFSTQTLPKSHPEDAKYYDEWPIREMAMSVYYAEKALVEAKTGNVYTDDLSVIQLYTDTPLDGTCLLSQPSIDLVRNTSNDVIGYTAKLQNELYVATVTQDRYLKVTAV